LRCTDSTVCYLNGTKGLPAARRFGNNSDTCTGSAAGAAPANRPSHVASRRGLRLYATDDVMAERLEADREALSEEVKAYEGVADQLRARPAAKGRARDIASVRGLLTEAGRRV
jgi:hypothetical protein